jgi:hypothetical protein
MAEPNVLEYLKDKLIFWKDAPSTIVTDYSEPEHTLRYRAAPWLTLITLALALVAQFALEPPHRFLSLGILFYILSTIALIFAILQSEWLIAPMSAEEDHFNDYSIDLNGLIGGISLAIAAFLAFRNNRFTLFNLFIWILGLITMVRTFWVILPPSVSMRKRFMSFFLQPRWNITISHWTLFLLAGIALAVFFRVYQLAIVPLEMISDHAEKLLDVSDVLLGQTNIFFPRNTGREAIQMYLTALVALLFGTGLSYTSLKIGTVLAGLLTLPYLYLLGKELGNRCVGWLAMVFAGIAYWPNVISRIGFRFPLCPLFVAPTLYYLLKGLRTGNQNNFIIAGLALGIGLYGYSAIRILPVVVVVGVGIYLLHRQSAGKRKQAVWGLGILALIALIMFLPMLRYALENPLMFGHRALTRIGSLERPFPGSAWEIFLQNLWSALTMFSWSNGEIWVHSIPFRPALDVVSAALFHLGVVLLLIRYLRQRRWVDLFLLLSVPLLMLPSILSLAFPGENPSLNRTGGAIVPVFLIIGISLETLLGTLKSQLKTGRKGAIVWCVGALLLACSAAHNYHLVFHQYHRSFQSHAWNTSEMGHLIHAFSDSVGHADSAWVVGYPHWVDTRLVAINAGYPNKDYAIWPNLLGDTLNDRRAKLFLIKPEATEVVALLRTLYPEGSLQRYRSHLNTKDFLIFFVPTREMKDLK